MKGFETCILDPFLCEVGSSSSLWFIMVILTFVNPQDIGERDLD